MLVPIQDDLFDHLTVRVLSLLPSQANLLGLVIEDDVLAHLYSCVSTLMSLEHHLLH